jgi:hypothetical protein
VQGEFSINFGNLYRTPCTLWHHDCCEQRGFTQ